ncbi:MAG: hypothetical protein M1835_000040 [Candelina submexicana]|nr:MAG: hypothetical protein M1835_000040 [Candelina submexicana]
MRDLFGVINSIVNEERRAQGLQTSTTIPLLSTKSTSFRMTRPCSDLASRAGIPSAVWTNLVEKTGDLLANILSEIYAVGSEELSINPNEIADANFDELVIRQGLLQLGTWGTITPSNAETQLLCARGVFRDLSRAILDYLIACQHGEHEEISESEDVCETTAPKRQTVSESVMPATDETLREQTLDSGKQPLKLHILYMDHGERMGPPLDLDVARCPNYLTLARMINKNIPEQDPKRSFNIQAHLFDGLHTLEYTEDFDEAIESAKRTKWMENELKIVVNMRENWKNLGDAID